MLPWSLRKRPVIAANDFNLSIAPPIHDFFISVPITMHGSRVGDSKYDPDCDLNGDGFIGIPDWNRFRKLFSQEPGPSGL